MKFFYIFVVYSIFLFVCKESLSKDVFDSDFFEIEVITSNPNEAKEIVINEIKDKSLSKLISKILDSDNKKKYNKLLHKNIISEGLIENIIIDKEIITNEKYIANIKINFNKQKIINLLRANQINYTELESNPFLVILSYNINFIKLGLDRNNIFYPIFIQKVDNNNELIKYFFPKLSTNDKFILSYDKIIAEDKNSFNKILNKYQLDKLIHINIHKVDAENYLNIKIIVYDSINNKEEEIVNLNYSDYKKNNEFYDSLIDNILFNLNEWWKKNNQINNNFKNKIQCNINSTNFIDLIKIKSYIENLSQVKYVTTKKIQIKNNLIEFEFYGDFDLLIKKLSLSNIHFEDNNGCFFFIK